MFVRLPSSAIDTDSTIGQGIFPCFGFWVLDDFAGQGLELAARPLVEIFAAFFLYANDDWLAIAAYLPSAMGKLLQGISRKCAEGGLVGHVFALSCGVSISLI